MIRLVVLKTLMMGINEVLLMIDPNILIGSE